MTQRSPSASVRAGRGMWGVATDPVFGAYLAGKICSSAGIWIHNVVAAILVYRLTGSTLMVGAVSVAQFAPQIFAPLSGAMADRGKRRRQTIMGRLVSAGGSGSLALWLAIAGVDGLPGGWPIIAMSLVVGVGFVIGGPAQHALIPSLVDEEELASAIALNSVPFTIARSVGPALGATVAVVAGPAVAFALAAAGNGLFAFLLWLRVPDDPAESAVDVDASIRVGFRHVGTDPPLFRLLIAVGAVGMGTDPAITLTPPMAAAFSGGEQLVGLLTSSFGVGAAGAFFLLSKLQRRFGLAWVGNAGLILEAVGLAALTVSPTAEVAMGAFAVAGAGLMMALTSLSTQVQERLPDELRGRVMALWSLGMAGSRPIAAAMNGALAEVFSVDAALIATLTVLLAAAVVARPSALRTTS